MYTLQYYSEDIQGGIILYFYIDCRIKGGSQYNAVTGSHSNRGFKQLEIREDRTECFVTNKLNTI